MRGEWKGPPHILTHLPRSSIPTEDLQAPPSSHPMGCMGTWRPHNPGFCSQPSARHLHRHSALCPGPSHVPGSQCSSSSTAGSPRTGLVHCYSLNQAELILLGLSLRRTEKGGPRPHQRGLGWPPQAPPHSSTVPSPHSWIIPVLEAPSPVLVLLPPAPCPGPPTQVHSPCCSLQSPTQPM